MKKTLVVMIGIIIFLSACGGGAAVQTEPTQTPELFTDDQGRPVNPTPPQSEKRCGDGICDGPENTDNCPNDCGGESELPMAAENSFWVSNPTSGNQLYATVTYPESGSEPYPAVVLIPGGVGDSSDLLSRGMAGRFADAGFVAVVFDPDGRGQSEGEEDYNGFIQQAGLATIITFTAELPTVDVDQIGLVSFSYGVTMASGALARYPDLPVIFYIDWEGPVDRYDTTVECSNSTKINFAACDEAAYWAEREALTFITEVDIPYLRLQSEIDHVQPDNSHALNIVNAAVAGSPTWVRLNDEPVNQTYDLNNPPAMIPEGENRDLAQMVVKYTQEMLALHGR